MHIESVQRILGIAGSLRRGSFNRSLLRAAQEFAAISIYDELGQIPLVNEDVDGGAAVDRLRKTIASADGVLFATPEYNWSIPGVLKNAIDWLSLPPNQVLIGKAVAIIGATPGRGATRLGQAALRQALTATESIVMPAPALFIQQADKAFDAGGKLIDDAYRAQLFAVIDGFSKWIGRF
jgi:chromate reductase